MALTDKITAIADAIRAKTGKTDTMTMDEMVRELEELEVSDGYHNADLISALIDRSITEIIIPEGTAKIGAYAFANCQKLAKATIPNSLQNIASFAFYNCATLEEITIPASVNTIYSSAFGKCPNMTKVIFKGMPDSIAAAAFSGDDAITDVYVPWSEGEVANAPWGAANAAIHYGYVADEAEGG